MFGMYVKIAKCNIYPNEMDDLFRMKVICNTVRMHSHMLRNIYVYIACNYYDY